MAFKSLNLDLVRELQQFWFEHIKSPEEIALPGMKDFGRWFMGGDEFDGQCVKRFSPALEELRAANVTDASQIIDQVRPETARDWVSLIILLDQIPRNCYRDAAAGPVFSFFDPLALAVTRVAADKGTFSDPSVRWSLAYRVWRNLPFVHSEDLAVHKEVERIVKELSDDVESLLAADADAETEEHRRRAIVACQKNPEQARFSARSQAEAEDMHRVILERFGRYPHRNKALGREMTAEEQEYLDQGGQTFAPPKDPQKKAEWEAKMAERK